MNSEKYRLLFDKIPSDASIALRQYARAGELKPVNGGYTLKSGCPFHGGKEPGSFFVYNDGHYHCFSCQAHGRIIDLLHRFMGVQHMKQQKKLQRKKVSLMLQERTIKRILSLLSSSLLPKLLNWIMNCLISFMLIFKSGSALTGLMKKTERRKISVINPN